MIEIYTDGGYRSSKNISAMAFIILDNNIIISSYSKAYNGGTNNRCEIISAAIALESLSPTHEITLFSDSKYVVDTFMNNWSTNENTQLWDRLKIASERHDSVVFKWVRAHNGLYWNEYVDSMCNRSMDEL